MHRKSDSEATSYSASSPVRSPRRPIYYVQSPSQQETAEKLSLHSSPFGSPAPHYYYHSSPIHQSRESTTTRFSASVKGPQSGSWRKLQGELADAASGEDDDEEEERKLGPKGYAICFVVCFVLLFTLFSFIIWGASKSYKPRISVKSIIIDRFNVQAGMDERGVPTKMLTINSTFKMFYRNPSTFFGVHASSTPIGMFLLNFQVASGHIDKFYQPRKSGRVIKTTMRARELPLYGAGEYFNRSPNDIVRLTLKFTLVSRAYVLGRLVKTKFYRSVMCHFTLKTHHPHLFNPINLNKTCSIH